MPSVERSLSQLCRRSAEPGVGVIEQKQKELLAPVELNLKSRCTGSLFHPIYFMDR